MAKTAPKFLNVFGFITAVVANILLIIWICFPLLPTSYKKQASKAYKAVILSPGRAVSFLSDTAGKTIAATLGLFKSSESESEEELIAQAEPEPIAPPTFTPGEVLGEKEESGSLSVWDEYLPLTEEIYLSSLQTSTVNILRNSSFEEETSDEPRQWKYQHNSTSSNTSPSDQVYRSGEKGLIISGGGVGNFGVSQPDVKLRKSRAYTLSIYIRPVNASSTTVKIGFWDSVGNKRAEMKDFSFSGTGEWQRIAMNIDNTGNWEGKKWFPMIEVMGLTSGSLVLDDAQLEEGTISSVYHFAGDGSGSSTQDGLSAIGDGSILVDTNGNIFPAVDDVGTLGKNNPSQFSALYLSEASINDEGNLLLKGSATIKGRTYAQENLDVSGAATVSGNFRVNGTTALNGVTTINANLNVTGTTTYTGGVTFTGHLLPGVDNTYDLGAAASVWRAGYFTSLLGGTTDALTITANAASTWSTSAGILTLQGDDGVNIESDAAGGIELDPFNNAVVSGGDNADDLGTVTNVWRAGYFTTLQGGTADPLTITVTAAADADDLTIQTTGSDGDILFVSADDIAFNTDDLFITDSGSIGINVTDPESLLEVKDTDAHPIITVTAAHDADFDPQIQFKTDATDTIKFSMGVDAGDSDYFKIFSGTGVGGTSEFVISDSGSVSIGSATFNSNALFAVQAGGSADYAASFFNDGGLSRMGIRIQAGADDAAGDNRMIAFFDGDGTAEGWITLDDGVLEIEQDSDIRLKENVVDTGLVLDDLNQLRVVDFNFIQNGVTQTGFIAQEVKEIFSDAVGHSTETDMYSVKPLKFIPRIVKGIQEQQNLITLLQDADVGFKGDMEVLSSDIYEKLEVLAEDVAEEELEVTTLTDISGELVVRESAEFEGELTVLADAVFKGKLYLENGLEVRGDLVVDGAVVSEFTAGEDLSTGDVVYISSTNAVNKASASSEIRIPAVGVVVSGAVKDAVVRIAVAGTVGGLKDLTVGRRYYVSVSSGSMTAVAPTTEGQVVQAVGVAKSKTELLVMPSLDYEVIQVEELQPEADPPLEEAPAPVEPVPTPSPTPEPEPELETPPESTPSAGI